MTRPEPELSVIPEDECLELLRAAQVGRVIVSIGALPAAFPVNFRVVDRQIVFRTNSGTKLAAAVERAVLGFEVDDVDLERRTGWSVLVVGMATVVTNPGQIQELDRAGIDSWWASGPSAHYVAIEMGRVSGRHIAGGPARSPDATAHG